MEDFPIYDDVWVPTQCGRCFNNCAINVRRVNGTAIQIEGNPDSWMGSGGGVCGKGAAGLQAHYDPNRLNVPLRRTNPEKGLHVDPKWKEVSWEEALDEIAERLKKVLEDDPKKILLQSATMKAPTSPYWKGFMGDILGTPHRTSGGGGIHCANGLHFACGLMHGSWDTLPDYRYCNYAIYWGVNNGHATGHAGLISARLASEAMERGMKLVVFDPICNYSASKATEWVPIIPGTDGAVILAMCNVILNDLGMFDSEYLKSKTNAPYLVDPVSLRYARDRETKKPLIWDVKESGAKVFDDPTITDYALEGTFETDGLRIQPSFSLLKDHLRKYTLQMASEVSSVPEETIRRIATEFAQAAQVGSTITIEGHQLPLRPVASVTFRGAEAHGNATHTAMAVCLLNQIVGAADVPGGAVGLPNTCVGYPETGKLQFGVHEGPDGFLSVSKWFSSHTPWPVKAPRFPSDGGLQQLFSLASSSSVWIAEDREDIWQRINLPYRIEVMLNFGCNSVLGTANPETQAEFLKRIPFIVSWDLVSNEFSEGFSDFLLPDTSYLETSNWMDSQGFFFNYPYGMDPWCCHVTQPVVEPRFGRRYIIDVCFELLDRLGKRPELNRYWNKYIGLDEADEFKPTDKVTWDQVGDRALKHFFGPDHGWDWFKKHGGLIWPKKVEEAYWRYFTKARVPVYLEFMVEQKEMTKKIADEIGIAMDWEQYTPFISWYRCEPHKVQDSSYDLFCFSYRDIVHTGSCTMEQPWLDEVSKMSSFTYNITMNKDVGEHKGLRDKDEVEVESVYGHKVRGTLKLRRGQHPRTISLVSAGHWAKGQPIAKGKGSSFTPLLETRFERCDPLTLNIETCVKVKVRKIAGSVA